MFPHAGSLLTMMSFAAGTFSAGASSNPQYMTFQPASGVPNNPLPLIIYPAIVPDGEEDSVAYFEDLFTRNQWLPGWRAQVFSWMHYHPNTHELLGVGAGWAQILFGGESGRVVTLRAGDAVLIPAGVGHQQLASSEDFYAIGAFPPGIIPETCRDDHETMNLSMAEIKRVPMPRCDPVTGGDGAVTEIWHPLAGE